MSAMLQQPFDLYKPGSYDQYLLGLVNQLAQAMDDSITDEVNYLLNPAELTFIPLLSSKSTINRYRS